MQDQDEKLLNEIYKDARMGMQATKILLSKTQDPGLNEQLTDQYGDYSETAKAAENELIKNNLVPEDNNLVTKAGQWGSLELSTVTGKEPAKIAELMIEGNNMGIVNMTKKIKEFSNTSDTVDSIAKNFIKVQEENIENLKQYL